MRLDIDRQNELEPVRTDYAKKKLEELGYKVTQVSSSEINFTLNGNTIKVFPYSGWFQGKGLTAGRGMHNLLKQLGKQ